MNDKDLSAILQVIEYCREFLFGRLGWNQVNGLLVISGAFGVFHKETVIEAGGYRRNTLGEDMELVVRLHRLLSQSGRPDRIVVASWKRLAFDLAADLAPLDHRSVVHQLLDRRHVVADDLVDVGLRLSDPDFPKRLELCRDAVGAWLAERR